MHWRTWRFPVLVLLLCSVAYAWADISSLANRKLEQLGITGGVLDTNVEQWNNITVTGGAGAVAAGTPRITLASDDPAVTALQIIDDWDETNRAAVNIIAGQVAITAGAGAVAANTPRATLASDDPAVVALQIIDDWDETNRAAVNLIAGQVAIAGGTGVDAANVPRVSLATNIPLPAGTNNIGDVDVLSVIPGTGATNLGKAEDAGHTTGDVGVMLLGVRNDVRGTLAGLDLDYAPLQLNSSGDVRVDGSAVTQPVSGTVTANQGTANATPWNENVAQINGVTPLMGNGVTGTGSQRVTVASDNTAFTVNVGTFPDNEPINVAQINGVAPLMGAGNTGTGSPRVTIATDQVVVSVKQAPGDAPCKTTTVNSQGIANAGIVVDATVGGVTVLAAAATRCGAVLQNLQGGGDALCAPTTITVTTTVGFYLAAGQSLALGDEAQQAWRCIRQAGTSATFYVAESTP